MHTFSICSPDDIAYHALAHTRAILKSRSTPRGAIDMSVESLVATAVSRGDYTRSVAIVARGIADRLRWEDALLARQFTERLADAAMEEFFSYWRERHSRIARGYAQKRAANAVDPIALCAYVGDLFALRMFSFSAFDDCVGMLLTFVPSALLLEGLHALFAHGCAHRHPALTPAYLLSSISAIERMCASYKGSEHLQEDALMALIYNIMFRANGAFVKDVVDASLDLDTVLMGSVCSPLNEGLYGTCAPQGSPGARSSTSGSSMSSTSIWSYTKAEQRDMEASFYQTRNSVNSSISTPMKRADSTSSEERPVVHISRPVSGVQWEQFLRD